MNAAGKNGGKKEFGERLRLSMKVVMRFYSILF
jgi:hypothetical protein